MNPLRKSGRCLRGVSLILVASMLLPAAASALQSGPSMPEVQKFSPVDAKDLVNLYTGDFVYTLPVMNVPGPEGEYALTLSYKAGIQTEEEASWVGLGWNLQAGSISRNVSEVPDDYRGGVVSYATPGYESYSVGVGVGIPNTPISVSQGLGWDSQGGLFGESGIGVKSDQGSSLGMTMRSYFYSGGSSVNFNASISMQDLGAGTEDQLESGGSSSAQPSYTVGVTNTGANPLLSFGVTIPIYFVNVSFSTSFMSGLYNNIEFGYLYKDMYLKARKDYGFGWNAGFWPTTHLDGSSRGAYRLLPVSWDWLGQISSIPIVGGVAHPAFAAIDQILNEWPSVSYKLDNREMYDFTWQDGFWELLDIFHVTKFATESGQIPELMDTNGDPYFPCWGMPNGNIGLPTEWAASGCTEANVNSNRLSRLVFSRYNSAQGAVDAGVKYQTKLDQIYTNDFNTKDIFIVNAQGLGGEIEPIHKLYSPQAVPNAALSSALHFWYPNYKFYDVIRDEYLEEIDNEDDLKAMNHFQFRFRGDPGGGVKQKYNSSLGLELAGHTGAGQNTSITGSKKIGFSVENPAGTAYNPNTGLIKGFSITKEDGVNYEFNSPVYNNNLASFSQDALSIHSTMPSLWSWTSRIQTGTSEMMHPGLENECIDFKTYSIAGIDPGFQAWIVDEDRSAEDLPERVTTFVDELKLGKHEFATKTFSKRWAYAWNLTGIKGTDYVDANSNGFLDPADYGFWVDFKYDDWSAASTCAGGSTKSYRWKSPIDGMSQAGIYQSNKFDQTEPEDYGMSKTRFTASTGSKTIQYLNHVKTATHVAFFETQDRLDAVGLDQAMNPDPTKKLKSLKRIVLLKLEDWNDVNSNGKVETGEFLDSDILQSVRMNYSYALTKQTPTSVSPENGKLTLESVQFGGKGGAELVPPYQFLYGNINPNYAPEKWDRWGMYKSNGKFGDHLETKANEVAAWSLSDIVLPSGGMLSVQYESDRYAYVQNKPTKREFDMNFNLEPREGSGITVPGFEYYSWAVAAVEDRVTAKDPEVNINLLWRNSQLLGARLPDIVPNPFKQGDILQVSFNSIIERHAGILGAIDAERENGWVFMETLILGLACSWLGDAVSTVISVFGNALRCVLPELEWVCAKRITIPFVGKVCVWGYFRVFWDLKDCSEPIDDDLICNFVSGFINPSKTRQKSIDKAASIINKLARYRVDNSVQNVTVSGVDGQYVFFGNGPDLATDVMNKYRIYRPSTFLTYGLTCFPDDLSDPEGSCTEKPVIKFKPDFYTSQTYKDVAATVDEVLTDTLLGLNADLLGVDITGVLRDMAVCTNIEPDDDDPYCLNTGADPVAIKESLEDEIGGRMVNVMGDIWSRFNSGSIVIGNHVTRNSVLVPEDPITNLDDILQRAFSNGDEEVEWPEVGGVIRDYATLSEFGLAFSPGSTIASIFGGAKTSRSAIALKLTGNVEERLGGGLRVKKVILDPGTGETPIETSYEYGTGVATSEPPPYGHLFLDNRVLKQEDGGLGYLPGPSVGYESVKVKRANGSYTEYDFLTPRTPENEVIPGGSASKNFAYSYLGQRIKDTDKLEEGLATVPDSWDSDDQLAETSPWSKVKYRNPSGTYGSLISRKSYTATNGLIETQKNNYKYSEDPVHTLTDGTANQPLGQETENYYTAKTMLGVSTFWNPIGNVQKPYVWLTTYAYEQPKILQVSTVTTRDGVSQVTQNHRWDPLTGAPSLVSVDNSDFRKWEYTVPYYLSNLDYSNEFLQRNMLTQSGKSSLYETALSKNSMSNLDLLDKDYLRSFTVNSWGSFDGVFRKRTSYAWKSPRDYAGVPTEEFPGFSEADIDPSFLKGEEILRYDRFGGTEETRDQRGTYSAMVYGYQSLHLMAVANNARMSNVGVFTADGGVESETHLDTKNGWLRGAISENSLSDPSVNLSNISHTGDLAARVFNAKGPNKNIREVNELQSDLVISAWVRPTSGRFMIAAKGVDQATQEVSQTWSRIFDASAFSSNSWKRVEFRVPLAEIRSHAVLLDSPEDYIQISVGTDVPGGGEVLVDDIRCAPADALIMSYTFDDRGSMTSASDENDVPTFYEFDKAGRLVNVRDYKGSVIAGGAYDVK